MPIIIIVSFALQDQTHYSGSLPPHCHPSLCQFPAEFFSFVPPCAGRWGLETLQFCPYEQVKIFSHCVQGEVLWVQFIFIRTERVVAHSLIPDQHTVACQAVVNSSGYGVGSGTVIMLNLPNVQYGFSMPFWQLVRG